MTERQERCETCRFWLELDSGGICRRNSPVPALAAQLRPGMGQSDDVKKCDECNPARAIWPRTGELDWCGEWQAEPTVEIKIEGKLALSPRARKTLLRGGFENLSQVTPDALREIRNCVEMTTKEIMDYVRRCQSAGMIIPPDKAAKKIIKISKHPLLRWSRVPVEKRCRDWHPESAIPDDRRCQAAAPYTFRASMDRDKIPRCCNAARESGLCFYHEKVLREAGECGKMTGEPDADR